MPSTSNLLLSFVCLSIAAMALVLWASQGEASEDGLIIAVFPPSTSERRIMEAVVAADGVLVRASLPQTVVVAHSLSPGFAARLKAQGVWLTYAQAPFGPELGGCMALASAPYAPASRMP